MKPSREQTGVTRVGSSDVLGRLWKSIMRVVAALVKLRVFWQTADQTGALSPESCQTPDLQNPTTAAARGSSARQWIWNVLPKRIGATRADRLRAQQARHEWTRLMAHAVLTCECDNRPNDQKLSHAD